MKNTWTNIKHEQNMSVRMCVCMHPCVHACVCVFVSVCVHVCAVYVHTCAGDKTDTQKLIFLPSTFLSKRERKITGEKSHTDLCPFKLSQKVTRPSVLMVITHA